MRLWQYIFIIRSLFAAAPHIKIKLEVNENETLRPRTDNRKELGVRGVNAPRTEKRKILLKNWCNITTEQCCIENTINSRGRYVWRKINNKQGM